jgi:hypothetical protein
VQDCGVDDPKTNIERPLFHRPTILGSQAFVESHFYKLKHKLGYQRRRPATRITALGGAETFWIFRDLRVRPIG